MKLIDDIRHLLGASEPEGSPQFLERVDATLTAGYAEALQLEGRRWRLQRRLGDVATHSADVQPNTRADEFAEVSRKLQETNDELARLRAILACLRERRGVLQQSA